MNNKTPLIINGVLGLAVIILFYLHFSKSSETTPSTPDSEVAINEGDSSENLVNEASKGTQSIAYVNSDTLTKYYEYNIKLSKELMGKQASAEAKLKSMYKNYQSKIQKYQKEAPIMGEEELQRKQMEIMQLEQEIAQKEQELSNSLADKNYQANLDYVYTTDKYLQRVGKELGYDFIIGYRTGDLVMYANPKYDITAEVIDLLNKAYQNDSTQTN